MAGLLSLRLSGTSAVRRAYDPAASTIAPRA